MKTFEPRVDALPPAQRRLWPKLKDTPTFFVLYGGTALALRLGHRESDDFDFFARKPFKPDLLHEKIVYLAGGRLRQLEVNTLSVNVRPSGVQISFFGGLRMGRVDPVGFARGPMIKVASVRDIAGTKLLTVMQRVEAKDYIDIHALLTQARLPLAELLACAKAIYGARFDPLLSMKALSYHDDPELSSLSKGLKKDLIAALKSTDPTRLPVVKPALKPAPKA
jgi:hypothetical protein